MRVTVNIVIINGQCQERKGEISIKKILKTKVKLKVKLKNNKNTWYNDSSNTVYRNFSIKSMTFKVIKLLKYSQNNFWNDLLNQ